MIIKDFTHLQNYVSKHFLEIIKECANDYVKRHCDEIESLKDEHIHSFDADVVGCRILDTFVQLRGGNEFYIVCKVMAGVHLSGMSTNEYEWDTVMNINKSLNLRMTLRAEFGEMLDNLDVESITVIKKGERFVPSGIDTRKFLPDIREGNLDTYAAEFLKRYYPQALERPMRLPIRDVIKAMGLTMRGYPLESGKYGKCYFADGYHYREDGTKERIPKRTILYKKSIGVAGSRRTNFTLMHECSHWYANYDYFARMSIIDPTLVSASYTEGDYVGNYADDFKLMEWQANALAPRILMPAVTTKQKFEELLIAARECWGDKRSQYKRAIKQLAEFFDVSIASAKIRLKELGYVGLNGIYDFVDGAYTKPYLYNPSKMRHHDTYSIGQWDFIKLSYDNEKIKELLVTRKFLYVEKFFVLNDKRFVRFNRAGELQLTEYALTHMDECALAFTCIKNEDTQEEEYSFCYLNRGEGGGTHKGFNSTERRNYDMLEEDGDAVVVVNDQIKAIELVGQLNGTVGQDIAMLMQLEGDNGISDRTLGDMSGLHYHRISAIRKDIRPADKKEILAICAALQTHPIVTHHLLSKIGCFMTASRQLQDQVYEYLINAFYDRGREAWNDFLAEANQIDWQIPYRMA